MAMFHRTAIIAISSSLTLAAGVAAGMAIGWNHASQSEPEPTQLKTSKSTPPKNDVAGLNPRVNGEQEHQVPKSGRGEAKPDPMRIAKELWDLITSGQANSTQTRQPGYSRAPDRRSAFRKLRPEMAEFFVRKFWEATSNDASRQYALEMAISCGGPLAASFLEELASKKSDRVLSHYFQIAVQVLGQGFLAPRPRQFPVNESLMARTRLLLTSTDKEDRQMAIAVLGFVEPSIALPLLMAATRADTEPYVRQSAIRELGRLGDASTLEFLRSNVDTLGAEMYKLYKPIQEGNTAMVIAPDSFTRAIKDAIEELEERLHKN